MVPPNSPPLTLWAPFPPPIGGVTRSAARLASWLEAHDRLARVVDIGRPRTILNAIGGRRSGAPHLFWCSTPEAVAKHSAIARALRGPRWLFVHGGQQDREYRLATRLANGVFDRIFVTNEELATLIDHWKIGPKAEIASAFVPDPHTAGTTGRVGTRLLVAIGAKREWYGLDVALDAFDTAIERCPELELTVIVYGDAGPDDRTAEIVRSRGDIRVEENVGDGKMADLLATHDVLLRTTTVDGDALLVREALDAGMRVIASDVVSRPAGCELSANTAPAFSNAIVRGGLPSTGDGMGPTVTELL